MSERFFVEVPVTGSQARLVDAEAQHVVKVMRAKVGDAIVVFDGSGAEFHAQIAATSRQAVELTIIERREVCRELPREMTLAVGLPKGDRQQWLVEKLTELGVTRLVPLICQRSVAQPVESALARLRRWVIEASKQCGRNRLMEVAPPAHWSHYAQAAAADARLIAHVGAKYEPASDEASSLIAAVGPEGGWSDDEVALAIAHGWQVVSLGPRTLRVETAAIAIAAQAGLQK